MSQTEIEIAMLALPENQRRELAKKLLASLPWEDTSDDDDRLLAELESRAQDDPSNSEAWLDGETVLAAARDRQSA